MAGKAAVVVTLRLTTLSWGVYCALQRRTKSELCLWPVRRCAPVSCGAQCVHLARQCAKVRQMTYQPNGFTLRKYVPVRSHVKGRKRSQTDV